MTGLPDNIAIACLNCQSYNDLGESIGCEVIKSMTVSWKDRMMNRSLM